MQDKHTPGPWKVYDLDSDTLHVGSISEDSKAGWKYDTICNIYEDKSDNYDTNYDFQLFSNAKANARLIAAAPELLVVLQELEESASYWSEYDVPIGIVDRIRAAIAKATVTAGKSDAHGDEVLVA